MKLISCELNTRVVPSHIAITIQGRKAVAIIHLYMSEPMEDRFALVYDPYEYYPKDKQTILKHVAKIIRKYS